jgi:dTMP kinase
MPTTKPKFITFEGVECSGKSIQAQLLTKHLLGQQVIADHVHEPGGTPYGEALRAFIKNPEIALPVVFTALQSHSDYPSMKDLHQFTQEGLLDYHRNKATETLMFLGARAEFAQSVKQLLAHGRWVISDRMMDSTIAYQGGGHQQDISFLQQLNSYVLDGLRPDLTLFLDIPIDVMINRMNSQPDEKNSYMEKTYDVAFYERVRAEYLNIAKREPERFKVIDGTASVEEVAIAVNGHVDALLAA